MAGLLLASRNVPFIILEKRAAASSHSRSLGIHPPSIEIFEKTGLLDELLHHANAIRWGRAFVDNELIGEIHFSELKLRFPFILTISQSITEKLLETKLLEVRSDSLIRSCEVVDINMDNDGCTLTTSLGTYTCDHLIGCDGKNSLVREKAGIRFRGMEYPDTYMMGDFVDGFSDRETASIHLCKDGLVESIPHGKNLRRWVIKTNGFVENPDAGLLAKEVGNRTGVSINPETCTMTSAFGTQKLIADTFIRERAILAGDAAHIVSPIGGQGMNLGWLDVDHLCNLFPDPSQNELRRFAAHRRKMALRAASRAEFNMKTGRSFSNSTLRKLWVRAMLHAPFRKPLMKRFLMQGL